MSFQRTRLLLVKMMDYLLDTLEKDPQYASYTMDSHSIMIEDYLQIRPEAASGSRTSSAAAAF